MFELNILNGFKTVGSFILYKDTLAFMIGPDNTGEKLGVMRLGGHIEENESYLQTLEREIKEEGSIEVNFLNSPNTFYKRNWNDNNYDEIIDEIPLDIKPLIIVGDKVRSTAVFLSYTEKEPKPSSEACGIIFLKENEVKRICSEKLRLRDFLDSGGKLIQQKEIDYNMEMYAGVHLTFLNRLIADNNNLVNRFINGKLI
ncbi:NUDIX hydrolase [Inconstantimicrobium mannanitabidum]|uniref:DNA mismatch repair protein MutT n=1 Tax=Inconstantimicrobium mannanitabidum TaxID=1604901 RepID=A0ACB5RB54_9CLOT|nr:NUDIX hydrolase [Clostridium sp. TW13]GKX66357.1 DNA mismatch repair protein MutT [Clostridium sp. TW13]